MDTAQRAAGCTSGRKHGGELKAFIKNVITSDKTLRATLLYFLTDNFESTLLIHHMIFTNILLGIRYYGFM